MRSNEILQESGVLDSALSKGWVRIKYVRLDGMNRIMLATTNPNLFKYVYKGAKRLRSKRIILVWEHKVGWRALRRNRILGWVQAGPID